MGSGQSNAVPHIRGKQSRSKPVPPRAPQRAATQDFLQSAEAASNLYAPLRLPQPDETNGSSLATSPTQTLGTRTLMSPEGCPSSSAGRTTANASPISIYDFRQPGRAFTSSSASAEGRDGEVSARTAPPSPAPQEASASVADTQAPAPALTHEQISLVAHTIHNSLCECRDAELECIASGFVSYDDYMYLAEALKKLSERFLNLNPATSNTAAVEATKASARTASIGQSSVGSRTASPKRSPSGSASATPSPPVEDWQSLRQRLHNFSVLKDNRMSYVRGLLRGTGARKRHAHSASLPGSANPSSNDMSELGSVDGSPFSTDEEVERDDGALALDDLFAITERDEVLRYFLAGASPLVPALRTKLKIMPASEVFALFFLERAQPFDASVVAVGHPPLPSSAGDTEQPPSREDSLRREEEETNFFYLQEDERLHKLMLKTIAFSIKYVAKLSEALPIGMQARLSKGNYLSPSQPIVSSLLACRSSGGIRGGPAARGPEYFMSMQDRVALLTRHVSPPLMAGSNQTWTQTAVSASSGTERIFAAPEEVLLCITQLSSFVNNMVSSFTLCGMLATVSHIAECRAYRRRERRRETRSRPQHRKRTVAAAMAKAETPNSSAAPADEVQAPAAKKGFRAALEAQLDSKTRDMTATSGRYGSGGGAARGGSPTAPSRDVSDDKTSVTGGAGAVGCRSTRGSTTLEAERDLSIGRKRESFFYKSPKPATRQDVPLSKDDVYYSTAFDEDGDASAPPAKRPASCSSSAKHETSYRSETRGSRGPSLSHVSGPSSDTADAYFHSACDEDSQRKHGEVAATDDDDDDDDELADLPRFAEAYCRHYAALSEPVLDNIRRRFPNVFILVMGEYAQRAELESMRREAESKERSGDGSWRSKAASTLATDGSARTSSSADEPAHPQADVADPLSRPTALCIAVTLLMKLIYLFAGGAKNIAADDRRSNLGRLLSQLEDGGVPGGPSGAAPAAPHGRPPRAMSLNGSESHPTGAAPSTATTTQFSFPEDVALSAALQVPALSRVTLLAKVLGLQDDVARVEQLTQRARRMRRQLAAETVADEQAPRPTTAAARRRRKRQADNISTVERAKAVLSARVARRARACAASWKIFFQYLGVLPLGKACPSDFADWLGCFPFYTLSAAGKENMLFLHGVLSNCAASPPCDGARSALAAAPPVEEMSILPLCPVLRDNVLGSVTSLLQVQRQNGRTYPPVGAAPEAAAASGGLVVPAGADGPASGQPTPRDRSLWCSFATESALSTPPALLNWAMPIAASTYAAATAGLHPGQESADRKPRDGRPRACFLSPTLVTRDGSTEPTLVNCAELYDHCARESCSSFLPPVHLLRYAAATVRKSDLRVLEPALLASKDDKRWAEIDRGATQTESPGGAAASRAESDEGNVAVYEHAIHALSSQYRNLTVMILSWDDSTPAAALAATPTAPPSAHDRVVVGDELTLVVDSSPITHSGIGTDPSSPSSSAVGGSGSADGSGGGSSRRASEHGTDSVNAHSQHPRGLSAGSTMPLSPKATHRDSTDDTTLSASHSTVFNVTAALPTYAGYKDGERGRVVAASSARRSRVRTTVVPSSQASVVAGAPLPAQTAEGTATATAVGAPCAARLSSRHTVLAVLPARNASHQILVLNANCGVLPPASSYAGVNDNSTALLSLTNTRTRRSCTGRASVFSARGLPVAETDAATGALVKYRRIVRLLHHRRTTPPLLPLHGGAFAWTNPQFEMLTPALAQSPQIQTDCTPYALGFLLGNALVNCSILRVPLAPLAFRLLSRAVQYEEQTCCSLTSAAGENNGDVYTVAMLRRLEEVWQLCPADLSLVTDRTGLDVSLAVLRDPASFLAAYSAGPTTMRSSVISTGSRKTRQSQTTISCVTTEQPHSVARRTREALYALADDVILNIRRQRIGDTRTVAADTHGAGSQSHEVFPHTHEGGHEQRTAGQSARPSNASTGTLVQAHEQQRRNGSLLFWAELLRGLKQTPLPQSPLFQQASSRTIQQLLCGSSADDGTKDFSFLKHFTFSVTEKAAERLYGDSLVNTILCCLEEDFTVEEKRSLLQLITGQRLLPSRGHFEQNGFICIDFQACIEENTATTSGRPGTSRAGRRRRRSTVLASVMQRKRNSWEQRTSTSGSSLTCARPWPARVTSQECDVLMHRLPSSHECINTLEIPCYWDYLLVGPQSAFLSRLVDEAAGSEHRTPAEVNATRGADDERERLRRSIAAERVITLPDVNAAWLALPAAAQEKIAADFRATLAARLRTAIQESMAAPEKILGSGTEELYSGAACADDGVEDRPSQPFSPPSGPREPHEEGATAEDGERAFSPSFSSSSTLVTDDLLSLTDSASLSAASWQEMDGSLGADAGKGDDAAHVNAPGSGMAATAVKGRHTASSRRGPHTRTAAGAAAISASASPATAASLVSSQPAADQIHSRDAFRFLDEDSGDDQDAGVGRARRGPRELTSGVVQDGAPGDPLAHRRPVDQGGPLARADPLDAAAIHAADDPAHVAQVDRRARRYASDGSPSQSDLYAEALSATQPVPHRPRRLSTARSSPELRVREEARRRNMHLWNSGAADDAALSSSPVAAWRERSVEHSAGDPAAHAGRGKEDEQLPASRSFQLAASFSFGDGASSAPVEAAHRVIPLPIVETADSRKDSSSARADAGAGLVLGDDAAAPDWATKASSLPQVRAGELYPMSRLPSARRGTRRAAPVSLLKSEAADVTLPILRDSHGAVHLPQSPVKGVSQIGHSGTAATAQSGRSSPCATDIDKLYAELYPSPHA